MNVPEKVFVAMPITTPTEALKYYYDDKDHFVHVYQHLFVPAIEATGRVAIPQAVSGADLIHAEIINSLSEASLVLCDMSMRNPNVFFELGIRCALNRPLCLVIDDVTGKPPFDMGIVNFFKYNSELRPWNIESQIKALAEHLETRLENKGQPRSG